MFATNNDFESKQGQLFKRSEVFMQNRKKVVVKPSICPKHFFSVAQNYFGFKHVLEKMKILQYNRQRASRKAKKINPLCSLFIMLGPTKIGGYMYTTVLREQLPTHPLCMQHVTAFTRHNYFIHIVISFKIKFEQTARNITQNHLKDSRFSKIAIFTCH